MRALRGYGIGGGAMLLVLAFIVSTLGPEGRLFVLIMGGLGLALLAGGLIANGERLAAFLKGRRGRAAQASVGYTLTVLAVVILVNFLAAR